MLILEVLKKTSIQKESLEIKAECITFERYKNTTGTIKANSVDFLLVKSKK